MSSSTIAIIITVITMVLFFANRLPMSIVACIGSLAMGILIPEMSLSDIYSGFGGSSIIMVAGMCIVGDALFQTGVAQKIGAKIAQTPLINNERVFIVVIVIICTAMSAFFIKLRYHCHVDAHYRLYSGWFAGENSIQNGYFSCGDGGHCGRSLYPGGIYLAKHGECYFNGVPRI